MPLMPLVHAATPVWRTPPRFRDADFLANDSVDPDRTVDVVLDLDPQVTQHFFGPSDWVRSTPLKARASALIAVLSSNHYSRTTAVLLSKAISVDLIRLVKVNEERTQRHFTYVLGYYKPISTVRNLLPQTPLSRPPSVAAVRLRHLAILH